MRPHRVNINEQEARELTFFKAERTCQWLFEAIAAARQRLNFDVWGWAIG